MIYDVIIIGSGPAGAASALGCQGMNTLMLDVGKRPEKLEVDDNFYELKGSDVSKDILLGQELESLHNISNEYIMPKLKSPYQRYVTDNKGVGDEVLTDGFNVKSSYALGGLANAWGAQFIRFDDSDLEDFPFDYAALKPYYDFISKEVGISGELDGLSCDFGEDELLLPPLRKSRLAENVLKRFHKNKSYFDKAGIRVGSPRLAVLSTEHGCREGTKYQNLEFFKPRISANYTPAYTIERLTKANELTYLPGYKVINFKDDNDGCSVVALNLANNCVDTFKCKKLIICAGAINSARIVLNSFDDKKSKLSIMDNGLALIPFISFLDLGINLEKSSFYNQLSIAVNDSVCKDRVTGTFYQPTGLLDSDLAFDLPMPFTQLSRATELLLPSMLVLHLWYPEKVRKGNFIQLRNDGSLYVKYRNKPRKHLERQLIKRFRKLGLISHMQLCNYPEPGSGYHYAGTLPMKVDGSDAYTTDKTGKLRNTKNVFIADGSVFPSLPAKNLSFTIMANSLRISESIKRELTS